MSKYNNGILDVTESFATLSQTGYNINLPNIIVLPGIYQGNNQNILQINATNIKLKYLGLIQVTNGIRWSERLINGFTIVILQNTQVWVNEELNNAKFIFFDVVSTYSIGTLTLNQPNGVPKSIEICQTPFTSLVERNRSMVTINSPNNLNSFQIMRGLFNYISSTESPSVQPDVVSITVDFNRPTNVPSCPANYTKCWSNNTYQPGRCLETATNTVLTTFCTDPTKCFSPIKKEGINYWQQGSGVGSCGPPPNLIESGNNSEINDIIGKGIVNLREGTSSMASNSNNFRSEILELQNKIEKQKVDISGKKGEILNTQELIKKNRQIIRDKLNILDDRNQQLQFSIDRNIYGKKVLYILLAIVISIVVILLFVNSFFKNKN